MPAEDCTLGLSAALDEALAHVAAAEERYGPFTSTHEALGVLAEEWDELRDAIRSNRLGPVCDEAIDLAAVALRLAAQCLPASESFRERSGA